jgi:hypothetical protein
MDWVARLYAIYGPDDVILNKEGRMQMRYNIIPDIQKHKIDA